MKKPFLILLITSVFLLSACNGEIAETPEIPAINVEVLDLSEKPQYQITEVGTIKAVQEVELVAKAAGTIGKFSVALGDSINAGDVLAVIDFDESNNPAKVNYDSANLQLANARQTYSETLANNQDVITRASLRVKTLEETLGRLQRNLEELKTNTDSTETTLELQLENAEKNADTAEVNYEKIVDQFAQSWEDLLSSTKTSLDGAMVNLESSFLTAESIINPSRNKYFNVSDMNKSFGVRDSLQRLETVNSYNSFRNSFELAKSDYQSQLPLNDYTTDSAISLVKQAAEDLRTLMSQVRLMLNNSVVSTNFSQTTLDSHLAAVKAAEATVLGQAATINGLQQSIASFKLDRTSQIATADNNRIIANNQLADARNAVLNFQTTGSGSVQDLEVQIQQTSNDLLSAQADLDSARRSAGIQTSAKNLEISTLNNQLKLAEKSLDNNEVTSSIDGVLSDLAVDEGDYVSPGTYLGKVIQHEQVKVVFYVAEEVADRLVLGQPFSFQVTNDGVHDYTGVINKISPQADPINKKIRVEGAISNEDLFLKPEMFINLELDISTETFDASKTYVPMNSIIFAQNDRYVYVLVGNKAVRKNIEIGEIYGMWVEVTGGLEKDDVLIVEGHRNLPPAGDVEVNVVE